MKQFAKVSLIVTALSSHLYADEAEKNSYYQYFESFWNYFTGDSSKETTPSSSATFVEKSFPNPEKKESLVNRKETTVKSIPSKTDTAAKETVAGEKSKTKLKVPGTRRQPLVISNAVSSVKEQKAIESAKSPKIPTEPRKDPAYNRGRLAFVQIKKQIQQVQPPHIWEFFPEDEDIAGFTGSYFNQIDGSCNPETQTIINHLRMLPEETLKSALCELSPQFKVVQYSLEKLDLLLHKELESAQYTKRKGLIPFLLAGYDHMHQKHVKTNATNITPFTSYKVNNFYQFLGATQSFEKLVALYAIGAAESYMTLHPTDSKASYPTVYGSIGLSNMERRWQYGGNVLFGYSFVDTQRNVPILNQKAKSNHDAWNISVDLKGAYRVLVKNLFIMPYDNIGYIYGRELNYQESGIPGNNYFVKNEYISLIRNALGFRVEGPGKDRFRFFVDGAWVYEHYFNNNTYFAALEGTSLFVPCSQTTPPENYGRAQLGMRGYHHRLDWQVDYTGLFGNNYNDNSINFKFAYKF